MDETADRYRKAGVVFFAWLMNRLTGARLTDTSNGYRALRATMLSDVVGRLEQDQYQTAELLITCLTRGWRVTERPTVWHERASGSLQEGREPPLRVPLRRGRGAHLAAGALTRRPARQLRARS